jgi:transposase
MRAIHCCRCAELHVSGMTDNQTRNSYPTDLTDRQWRLLAPILARIGVGRRGRPSEHGYREMIDAILYVVRSGCAWRLLPNDLPPWQSVYGQFRRWVQAGVWSELHDHLREKVRRAAGKKPTPTASIIDSQTVRGADTVGSSTRGYDAGKRTNGRKRHIAVDTLGLLLVVMVTPASCQDRSSSKPLLWLLRQRFPSVRLTWADGGYNGKVVDWFRARFGAVLEIVRRNDDAKGFEVLPHRWIVERTFGWFMKCRRMTSDYERRPETSVAMAQIVMVGIMTRRLAS